MRSLHIIMPMGGLGMRFKNSGIDTPKPLIDVLGKPMFIKALDSFNSLNCNKKFTFIIRFDQDQEYNISERIKEYVPNANFVILTENTRGAVETCSKAIPYIDEEDSIIIVDCDLEISSEQYFNDIQNDILNEKTDIVGRLVSFKSNNPRYSYAKVDENGFVTQTAEKIVISDNAIAGSYYFSQKDVFEKIVKELINDYESGVCDAKEVYLSLLYNKILKTGKKVKLYTLDKYNSFGTPEELETYLNKINRQVKGHSGCKVEQKTINNKIVFEKSTADTKYINRLKLQEHKQNEFYEFNKMNLIGNIKTPKIVSSEYTDLSGQFSMEFIDGKSFIDYFENIENAYDVDKFKRSIINFIDYEIDELCTMKNVDHKIIYDKFKSCKNNILKNDLIKDDKSIYDILEKYENIFSIDRKYKMPVGKCHGDFTLSNILFKDDQYYIIDFLDSFIETPLMDIVKLRQDTKYNWSYLLINDNKDFDISKKILFDLDEQIVNHYSKKDFYIDSYKILQQMNFLRILQYAKDEKVIKFLKITLENLFY